MTDLTERLRKGALVRASQKFTYELDGVTIEAATGEVRELCHPDALEAATTLETLTQENARLREALGQYSLVALIGMINAAGGKITVRPKDVENAINQEMVAHYDPTNDTKVYRVRARKALGGGDE